jgi:hypothetical protein
MNPFVIVKLAVPAALEFAHRGHTNDPIVAVSKIDAPLVRLGIVQAQTSALQVAPGTIDLEFHHVRPPIPNFPDERSPVIFAPGIGAGKRMAQTRTHFEVRFP